MASDCERILAQLRRRKNPENIRGMARFGISAKAVLGIAVPELRTLAKRIGPNHELARALWSAGIYEARLLGIFIADPKQLTRAEAEDLASKLECWADCDSACIHLFRKTVFAHSLAVNWSRRKPELVKRAGFTMIATLAVHDKASSDETFRAYLKRLIPGARDERHNVKKAVNWALRQIGKRSASLRTDAIRTARSIHSLGTPAARWIASDALREFQRVPPRRSIR